MSDTSTLNSRGTGGVSSVDEIWGTHVDEENSSEYRNLLVQVHRRTEDVAGGVSFDAKSIPDWQREEPQVERKMEGGEWWHPSID